MREITMADIGPGEVELLRVVRANFSDDSVDAAFTLAQNGPSGNVFTTRLGAAAYRKGLLAGLSADSCLPEPVNPYPARVQTASNFQRGGNNPFEAWKYGYRDGQRVRTILLFPEKAIIPALLWREVKILPVAVREKIEAKKPKNVDTPASHLRNALQISLLLAGEVARLPVLKIDDKVREMIVESLDAIDKRLCAALAQLEGTSV